MHNTVIQFLIQEYRPYKKYLNNLTWFIVVVHFYRNRLYNTHVKYPVKLNINAKFMVIWNLQSKTENKH